MAQMYKVFIKDSLLIIGDTSRPGAVDYLGEEQLMNIVRSRMQTPSPEIYVFARNLKAVWASFKKIFKVIESAGGAVLNPDQKLLMIYRLGKWDLPKGKIEFGEPKEMAAVREVEEETGVPKPRITGVLPTTYHIYELDGRMILKRTHWYAMNIPAGFDFLVPQLEEDILDASWCDAQEVFENRKNTYGNIALILDAMDEEVL
jgi:8-oxo-dGTP pyrophosphatase MutT (NUDIX family)